MRHSDFASLLPSQRASLIEAAVAALPFPSRLSTFSSGASKTHTYATVAIENGRGADGGPEHATYLVCPQNIGAILARTGQHSGAVYLDSGNYGFQDEHSAVVDMFDRANR